VSEAEKRFIASFEDHFEPPKNFGKICLRWVTRG